MVKYKINLKFKENGKSLNELITEVLKIELNNKITGTCNIFKNELPFKYIHHFQSEWSSK